MDDGLVLNIVAEDAGPSKHVSGKKGGRWTERLKVKRSLKRKAVSGEKRPTTSSSTPSNTPDDRPKKKVRIEPVQSKATPRGNVQIQEQNSQGLLKVAKQPKATPIQPSKPSQIISSLFSYNPKIEAPELPTVIAKPSAPSNAPLDSSTFEGLGLNPLLIAHLKNKMSIQKPTAIQRAALPVLLSTLPEKASRDVFLQSQTGSGKTLSYLLPIIQDLLPLSSLSYIDRSIGTLAVIIAPTRELAQQISDVLEALLKMRLRAEEDSENAPQMTRWLVSGVLLGGATRTHEKARLRKGLPILVSTPGRLLDHLQNTSSFNVGKCRWLVLDEADQLMELGFEETIKGINQGLDGRRRLAKQAMSEGVTAEFGWDWERRRKTVLCSATIREDVQKLAGTTLVEPLMVKPTEIDKEDLQSPVKALTPGSHEAFTPPSQLSQKYVTVPLKLRLVTLVALLRKLVAETQMKRGAKIIVFLSCTDSVDFHWNLLTGASMDGHASEPSDNEDESDEDNEDKGKPPIKEVYPEKVEATCSLLPDVKIFRLHGSLPTPARLAALKGFAGPQGKNKPIQETAAVLFCTSVASRGLDLPLVRAVIQYDLPTEGGHTEYVHRVGRTARAGKGGEAWSFVAPSEQEWVKWVEGKMKGDEANSKVQLSGVLAEDLLRSGFGGSGNEYEQRATEVQLTFERWVLRNKDNAQLARKAFLSHMRAYATHPSSEKHIFHIRNLHMGHLAKAFSLRDAPKSVKASGTGSSKKAAHKIKPHRVSHAEKTGEKEDWERDHSGDAEKRMQAVVRTQGRLTKRGGVMVSTGASEFQISSTADLEKMLAR